PDRVAEQVFPKFSDRQRLDRLKLLPIEDLKNEPGDLIFVRVDERLVNDLIQPNVGEYHSRRNALALGSRSYAGELVARFLLVSAGKDLAKIGKLESLAANGCLVRHSNRPTSRLSPT